MSIRGQTLNVYYSIDAESSFYSKVGTMGNILADDALFFFFIVLQNKATFLSKLPINLVHAFKIII